MREGLKLSRSTHFSYSLMKCHRQAASHAKSLIEELPDYTTNWTAPLIVDSKLSNGI